MKLTTKNRQRFGARSPIRAVSLNVRTYQVTMKVKTPVPQTKPALARGLR